MCVCGCFLGGPQNIIFPSACDHCEDEPAVFLSSMCVCVHVFRVSCISAYTICYTTSFEGVALVHPQPFATVIVPFFRSILIAALGMSEHQHTCNNNSQMALFAAKTETENLMIHVKLTHVKCLKLQSLLLCTWFNLLFVTWTSLWLTPNANEPRKARWNCKHDVKRYESKSVFAYMRSLAS